MYAEYKVNFDEADVGSKGYLTTYEFDLYISTGDATISDKEKKCIIRAADINSDGTITFNEFSKFLDVANSYNC